MPTTESPDQPVFKILCVDGGGFKGLCSAAVLEVLENERGSLVKHFDMLCGTSTGGLIVLALAAGKSATQVVEFYQEWGPNIFPQMGRHDRVRRGVRAFFGQGKNRRLDEDLRKAVQHIVGELRIRDSNSFLCIPAFETTGSKPRVFKTDHGGIETTRDSNLLMAEVALATAAAPTYYPIASVHEANATFNYLDGGIWANNPSLVGLVEAYRFFVGPGKPYGSVRILSVASASPVAGHLDGALYSRSPLAFAGELLEAVSEAQSKSINSYMDFLKSSLCVPVDYVRIPSGTLSGTQSRGIGLDTATPQAIQTLMALGKTTGHEWKAKNEILAFFEEKAVKYGL